MLLLVVLGGAEFLPVGLLSHDGGFRSAPGSSGASVGAQLSAVLSLTGQTSKISHQFLGVDVHVVGVNSSSLAALVNATPFVAFRFSPMGEATDQVHALTYTQDGVPYATYAQTDAEFVSWCRWVDCHATMMVPAEIDNASEAAATVRYVENALGFHPAYWAIGNEPQMWTHWRIPWADWRSTDNSTPSPSQYAHEVHRYVSAMRAVDPAIKIIGIESVVGGSAAQGWFRDLVRVNGPNLTAVAYHAYPLGGGNGPASASGFYAALGNPSAFPLNYPATKSIVHAACPTCKIPIFVDEFNAGMGGNYTTYLTSFPEVPFVAAALITALHENARRVTFFDLEDLDGLMPYGLTTVGGGPRPAFDLYSQFLDRMGWRTAYGTALSGGPSGVYDALTSGPSVTSLLIANTNVTDALNLTVNSNWSAMTGNVTVYSWNDPALTPAAPLVLSSSGGRVWVVPPQSLLLLVWT